HSAFELTADPRKSGERTLNLLLVLDGISGCRGAALKHSHIASGVYALLICWHGQENQLSAKYGRRIKAALARKQNML
ncbi:hypothetical protein, partial [Salmonella enterica]|uniref:hypothetical protein n=1 Tax=Salmonella enterica TaxID=28901 RepID=UPI0020C2E1FC